MTTYAEVQGEKLIRYPYTIEALREENPSTFYPYDVDWGAMFPLTETAINNGYTLTPVVMQDNPAYVEKTQKIVADEQPVMVDGVWTIRRLVVDKTPEEIQQWVDDLAASVRAERDRILAASDWRVIRAVETGTTLDPGWAAYRQALRDITAQAGFPEDVTWPTEPQ